MPVMLCMSKIGNSCLRRYYEGQTGWWSYDNEEPFEDYRPHESIAGYRGNVRHCSESGDGACFYFYADFPSTRHSVLHLHSACMMVFSGSCRVCVMLFHRTCGVGQLAANQAKV